jgi:hypothetical protein
LQKRESEKLRAEWLGSEAILPVILRAPVMVQIVVQTRPVITHMVIDRLPKTLHLVQGMLVLAVPLIMVKAKETLTGPRDMLRILYTSQARPMTTAGLVLEANVKVVSQVLAMEAPAPKVVETLMSATSIPDRKRQVVTVPLDTE